VHPTNSRHAVAAGGGRRLASWRGFVVFFGTYLVASVVCVVVFGRGGVGSGSGGGGGGAPSPQATLSLEEDWSEEPPPRGHGSKEINVRRGSSSNGSGEENSHESSTVNNSNANNEPLTRFLRGSETPRDKATRRGSGYDDDDDDDDLVSDRLCMTLSCFDFRRVIPVLVRCNGAGVVGGAERVNPKLLTLNPKTLNPTP